MRNYIKIGIIGAMIAVPGMNALAEPNNAEQRRQMVIRMRSAVNEISKQYDSEAPFAFVFTNDPNVSRVMRHNAAAIEQLVPIEELVDSRMADVRELDQKVVVLEDEVLNLAERHDLLASKDKELNSSVAMKEAQLRDLSDELTNQRLQLTAEINALQSAKDNLNAVISARRVESTKLAQSNATQRSNLDKLVSEFNRMQNEYTASADQIRKVIADYNAIQSAINSTRAPTMPEQIAFQPVVVPQQADTPVPVQPQPSATPVNESVSSSQSVQVAKGTNDVESDIEVISLIGMDRNLNTPRRVEPAQPEKAKVSQSQTKTVAAQDDKKSWWDSWSN